MAVAVDQGFAERIARIEKGKQWHPDGVVVTTAKEAKTARNARLRAPVPWYTRLFSFLLTLVLMGGMLAAFLSQRPELADRVLPELPAARAALTATGG